MERAYLLMTNKSRAHFVIRVFYTYFSRLLYHMVLSQYRLSTLRSRAFNLLIFYNNLTKRHKVTMQSSGDQEAIPYDELDPGNPTPNAEYIVRYAKQYGERGNPESILKAVDEYCGKYARRAMNVGSVKGGIVENIFKERNPDVALELGAFFGYSAVKLARFLKPGGKLWSIEYFPESTAISKELVEFAGLSDKVTFITGSTVDVIPRLRKDYGIEKIDFVFLDHDKRLYKSDAIQLADSGLLQKGSVLAADNVIYPGAPDYLEYVRNSPRFESTFFESHLEFRTHIKDGIEKSVFIG